MTINYLKLAATLTLAAIIITVLSLSTSAKNYSDGAPGAGAPYETAFGGGAGDDSGVGGNEAYGGRLGENYNSPAANGGGEVGGSAGVDSDVYEATSEEGEVLGVMEDNSATVGVVIAIIIALAVIVLIIALIPRGTVGG